MQLNERADRRRERRMDLSLLRPHPSIDLAGRTQPPAATWVRASRGAYSSPPREEPADPKSNLLLSRTRSNCSQQQKATTRDFCSLPMAVVESFTTDLAQQKILSYSLLFLLLVNFLVICFATWLEVDLIEQAYFVTSSLHFRQLYLFLYSRKSMYID